MEVAQKGGDPDEEDATDKPSKDQDLTPYLDRLRTVASGYNHATPGGEGTEEDQDQAEELYYYSQDEKIRHGTDSAYDTAR